MGKEIRMNAEALGSAVSDGIAPLIYADRVNALTETMEEFGVPSRGYSLFDTREDSMCLTYKDGKWNTFICERGNKESFESHDDFDDAAMAVIESGATSLDQLTQMIKYYSGLVSKEPTFPQSRLNERR